MRTTSAPWEEPTAAPVRGRANVSANAAEREFRQLGDDRFVLSAPGLGFSFEVSRLRRERGSPICELVVATTIAGAPTFDGVLSSGDLWLANPRQRSERAKLLACKARTGNRVDFEALLEELALRVVAAERRGAEPILLRDAPRAEPDAIFDVHGFPLLKRHPLILFGDGGTGKSLLALYFAGELARRGLPVALFDWELGAEDHKERFERLFGAEMPPLLYVRCARPLVVEQDRLRRIIQDRAIAFAVFDSVAFACDGPPEAAEVAARYQGIVRGLNIGSLHVAHINKSERAEEKPFGSQFWHNGARSTWFIKPADAGEPGSLTVGLFHKKANLGRLQSSLGYRLEFGRERTHVARVDLADVESLAPRLPLRERLRHVLARGPMTTAAIAEALDAKPDSVEKAAKRSSAFVRLVDQPDGIHRWALARRPA